MADDLARNRAGRLGDAQRAYLDELVLSRYRSRLMAVPDDLAADVVGAAVVSADADIIFDAMPRALYPTWQAHFADGLRGPIVAAQAPLPGRRRVYCLPRTRTVVGAEPSPPDPTSVGSYGAVLAAVQGLSPAERDVLRAGRFPDWFARLARRGLISAPLVAGLGLLATLTAFGAIAQDRVADAIGPGLVATAALAGLTVSIVRPMLRARTAAASGRVRIVDAPARLWLTQSKLDPCRLSLGNETFNLSDRAALWTAVLHGVMVRGYVTDAGMLVALDVV